MILTEADARQVLEVIHRRLVEIRAQEVLDGIEESRRLGGEESLTEADGKDIKQVGRTRRRPLSAIEELEMVLQRLQERIVVVPRLATSMLDRLKVNAVEWRVDTEFVSANRIPEVNTAMLLPLGHEIANVRISEIKIATKDTFARARE